MKDLYTELTWLPLPPDDVNKKIKELDPEAAAFSGSLRVLSTLRLNHNQLTRLGNQVTKAVKRKVSIAGLSQFRLAILSNSTMEMIVPVLVASAVRHGIALEVISPAFDQVAQEALSPDSLTNRSAPDAAIFALDYRSLPMAASPGNAEEAERTIVKVLSYLASLREGIKGHSRAVCIFQTFAPPPESLFGSLDAMLPGTLGHIIGAVNARLAQACLASGDILFDVAGLANTVGLSAWHDVRMWNMGKFPFSDDCVPLYADHVGRLLGAIRGKSRKALILDLDNTLWGGVIGDDGLDGIKIAQGDATGEAHLSVQRLALDLRARGIVLAVCSKNTDEVARKPFESHPEMLLKLGDIAVFQANWNDKATNIRSIARELSLGIDAMVFLDDNPAERGLVRSLLPEVAVPELPDDAAYYARTLSAAGYFEAIAFAAEDRKRADFYQDNAKRAELLGSVGGVEEYLASLDMTITFQPFDPVGRSRIVQLINKSNQYNLTTRRYTEPEVESMEDDPSVLGMQIRLSDIFGDNGMISVVICRPFAVRAWDIDTWLMSCRVLGRKVENMVLGEILRHASSRGIDTLYASYIPSEKNNLVVDHYQKLGFEKIEETPAGVTRWSMDVRATKVPSVPMKVVSGFS